MKYRILIKLSAMNLQGSQLKKVLKKELTNGQEVDRIK